MKVSNEPYDAGREAHRSGQNLLDNPYIRKPRKTIAPFSEWEAGWCYEEREARRERAKPEEEK